MTDRQSIFLAGCTLVLGMACGVYIGQATRLCPAPAAAPIAHHTKVIT